MDCRPSDWWRHRSGRSSIDIPLLFRRQKHAQNWDQPWTGKPELHAESLPGVPGLPKEVDAEPRPPQELETKYVEPGQQTHYQIAEMPVNEVPAQEMDVETPARELSV